MRILITGGHGQLGKALQAALVGDDVIALGHAELDITDAAAVTEIIRDARPDAVIHAAAWTDTAGCENDPERAVAVNADGARHVAEACASVDAAMVHVGSNEVFDGEKGAPYVEDDPTRAINEYGRSKLLGENAVRETLDHHYIVRTSWLYGPGRVSFPEKILQGALDRGSLKLVTDEVANPTWTVDLASATTGLAQTGTFGTYHLVNEGACSRKEWAEEVLRLARIEVPIEAAIQTDFGAPSRKPVNSELANLRGAAIGITMRPWQEALAEHMRHPFSEVARILGARAAP